MNIPNNLRLTEDGTLFCADGTDIKSYLADWAKRAQLSPDEPLTLMRREVAEELRHSAFLLNHLAS